MSGIHPTAIIEGDVTIGAGSTVGPLCYLRGPIVIGAGTTIYPHCVIGTEGEHKTRKPEGVIRIGDRCTIRELVVIQRGTGDRETQVKDNCYVMDHCHIAHDVLVEEDVTMSPNVVLGGHTVVQRAATIGIGAMTHQFSTVGAWAMVGMGAAVTKDVPPLALVAGNPARFHRFNSHHFTALGVQPEDLQVVDGVLASGHPVVREALARFTAQVRRTVLPLVPRRPE